ncbi:nonsense-mediated mRNA decay protein, putative [Talaromyces stipitatus ATCC 10500]|uniref:Nonsense-mediated mRNA decay protein, putative n=1 Tax=Talaromyces stipitatus (strain ATCC 10500 / CBS 375.48 / QM 6759 / NRRL 1006) TaxID=441959 RepID=B8MV08_TALSN|nr:nonsense-mediated mRNA decay protein, putative [Talaromyces stipitatus ATCC 10500]EED11898.1 nonsense-mediated mRNA decay protein, putative [Talaromyces stipitatus ATCC 10500]
MEPQEFVLNYPHFFKPIPLILTEYVVILRETHIANGEKPSRTQGKPSWPSGSLSNSEREFRSWKHSIPLNSETVLSSGKLALVFQKAHQLIEIDVSVRQAVIQKLSEDGGLGCIKMLVEQNFEQLPTSTKEHLFQTLFLPLLKTISHPDVLQSLILERPVGTIYNFLFGVGGIRASKLLTFCSEVLMHCTKDESTLEWLDASVLVFSRIVDLNSTALVQVSLKNCASQFQLIFTTWVTDHPEHPLNESRVHLERLLRRFEVGVSLPNMAQNNVSQGPKVRGSFVIAYDPPGGRHDNDHTDICQIRIMPTFQEISSRRHEYLPPFDPTQWHVNGFHGLLDRNFRLLREDTVGLLRDAIHSEIQPSRSVLNHKSQQRTNVYQSGRIVQLGFHWKDGFQFKLGFSQPTHVGKMTAPRREEWWNMSKRLQSGALVCLILQRNSVVFCTVINPQATAHKRQGQNDNKSQHKDSDFLWKDSQEAAVFLQLTSLNDRSIEMVLNNYTTKDSHIALVEFPGVLLPAFEPTLKALQLMKRIDNLPFSELLIPNSTHAGSPTYAAPLYAAEPGFQFNLRCLMNDNSDFFVRVGHPTDLQKLRQNSSLDGAQASALIHTLQRKIGLIQGPPGTGKSYTGVALIKVLLANKGRGKKSLGPIICVTYTNHALDQLLESLLQKDVTKQIVRMGGQSKSESLKPYNLHELARNFSKTKMEKGSLWICHNSLERCEKEFDQIGLRDDISPTRVMTHLRDSYPAHYNQLFGIDEDGFQHAHKDNPGKAFDQWRKSGGKASTGHIRRVAQLESVSLWQMSQPERESLYKHWQAQIQDEMHQELINICISHKDTRREFDNILSEVDLRCLSQADVIGVTTTGLARNLNMLRRLKSKVVLCEEAGEVLEPHLLTALLPSVEHAILIGDHYQLRPQVQNYELSRENKNGGEKYSLDVSLFERLVEIDSAMGCGLPYSTLQTQRRMHPSIAQLVRETLYPQLQDAPSVSDYPQVRGIRKILFWLDHRELEGNLSNAEASATSRWNDYEVEMTTALVNHLVCQGQYGSGEIAVLTPYLGQLQKLRRRLGRSFAITLGDRDQDDLDKAGLQEDEELAPTPIAVKGTLLQSLRVATIDNFQGEEASVVVISLVRSNPQNKCGFLRTSNRINVLLSRAKHGMYIIGNSITAMHVLMWADVINIFQRNENIGTSLELQCPRHPETLITVSKPDDFPWVSPEGGCDLRCIKRSLVVVIWRKGFPAGRARICRPYVALCLSRRRFQVATTKFELHVTLMSVCFNTGVLCNAGVYWHAAIRAKTNVSSASQELSQGMSARIMEFVDRNVAKIRIRALTDATPLAMVNSNAHHASHPAKLTADIPNARESVRSRAHPAPKRNVFLHVRTLLACGHQCPSVCGEICPPEKYCQICGSEEIKDYPVDFILGESYKDIDLDDNPCIFPKCGHFLTTETLDGLMDIGKYYVLDERRKPSKISTSSEPFSISDIKTCATCRGPLRNIARYGRLVRRAILDESTKKLILYLNREYVPLAQELPQRKQQLQDTKNERSTSWPKTIRIRDERNALVRHMRLIISPQKNGRWKEILDLRQRISTYQKRVSPEEQPFIRVHQLATNARRWQNTINTSDDFGDVSEVLQTKGFLQGTALSLRLDIELLADFLEMRRNALKAGEIKVDMDLSAMRTECETLIKSASESKRPLYKAEGYIFLAQLHAFERSHSSSPEMAERHLIEGKEAINEAKTLCNENPGQTQGLATDIEGAEKMLRGTTFYTAVTNEERMAVIAAMAREFSGTGHWYYCRNGHPFTIGECGMAMQRAVCPECGEPVGGQNHQAVEGVTHARDLEVTFAQMGLH